MHRYGDTGYVLNLNLEDGLALIDKAYVKSAEEILMKRWIAHYQHRMSFDEFKNEVTENSYARHDSRSQNEILDMVYGIIAGL